MSAEILRRAAALMREDSTTTTAGGPCEPDLFTLAVADWLDMFAAVHEAGHSIAFDEQALAVARAYLGESA